MVSKVYNNVFAMFIQKIYHGYLTSMLDDKGMFLSSLSGIKKIIILVLFVFGHFQGLKAQFVEFGFNLSGNTYQGDISPLTWRLSMQGANFAYGLNAGYHFNKYLSLKISYNRGSIEANDKYAVDKLSLIHISGMSASVDIYTRKEENVITVPIQSVAIREKKDAKIKKDVKTEIQEDQYNQVVFIMDADTAKMVIVTTGIQDNEFIHVISGVKSRCV